MVHHSSFHPRVTARSHMRHAVDGARYQSPISDGLAQPYFVPFVRIDLLHAADRCVEDLNDLDEMCLQPPDLGRVASYSVLRTPCSLTIWWDLLGSAGGCEGDARIMQC